MKQEPEWWAEARRMRAAGEKMAVIEATLGKTAMAVHRAINQKYRAAATERTRRWMNANRDRINEYRRSWVKPSWREILKDLPVTIRLKRNGSRAAGDGGVSRRSLKAMERRGLVICETICKDGLEPLEIWRRNE